MTTTSYSIAEPVLRLSSDGEGSTSWERISDGAQGTGQPVEIEKLGITPVSVGGQQPGDAVVWLYKRTERPAQGRLSRNVTRGLVVVMLDAKHPDDPHAVAALRDWADFDHIPEIVGANVPGLTMVTPYEIVGSGPRYLHLYEFDHNDPAQGLEDLGRILKERLSQDELKRFASHPERRRTYAGAFRRVW